MAQAPIKVRDLWEEHSFTRGKRSDPPEVSVILPTFRRAASGLLHRAVQSVLRQSLERFELVVIDDGSTDGTANYLARMASKDGRISYCRFKKNSGLPAAAVDFGIINSRAPLLAFMFDDDVWYHDALENLYREASRPGRDVVYGKVRMFYRGRASKRVLWMPLGEGAVAYRDLVGRQNLISNNAVMVRRTVFDRVGMYDPHILIRRLSDWDLWRRVARHFRLYQVNRWIGEVWGPTTADSLQATVQSNWDIMLKYMMTERDELLKPNVIADHVVNDWSHFSSSLSSLDIPVMLRVMHEYYLQVGDTANLAAVSVPSENPARTDYPDRSRFISRTIDRTLDSLSAGHGFLPMDMLLLWTDWTLQMCSRFLRVVKVRPSEILRFAPTHIDEAPGTF